MTNKKLTNMVMKLKRDVKHLRGLTMSRIPKVKQSKYNKDKSFAWVDSQWERFMTEQKELKKKILELKIENSEMKDRLIELGERPDEWRIEQFNRNRAQEDQVTTIKEMKERIKELFPTKYIYESPDGGETIYRREFGDYNNKVEVGGQLDLFDD